MDIQEKIIDKVRSAAYGIARILLEQGKSVHVVKDFENDIFYILVDEKEAVTLTYKISKDPNQSTLTDEKKKDDKTTKKPPKTKK